MKNKHIYRCCDCLEIVHKRGKLWWHKPIKIGSFQILPEDRETFDSEWDGDIVEPERGYYDCEWGSTIHGGIYKDA